MLPYMTKGLQEHDVRLNKVEEMLNLILEKIC